MEHLILFYEAPTTPNRLLPSMQSLIPPMPKVPTEVNLLASPEAFSFFKLFAISTKSQTDSSQYVLMANLPSTPSPVPNLYAVNSPTSIFFMTFVPNFTNSLSKSNGCGSKATKRIKPNSILCPPLHKTTSSPKTLQKSTPHTTHQPTILWRRLVSLSWTQQTNTLNKQRIYDYLTQPPITKYWSNKWNHPIHTHIEWPSLEQTIASLPISQQQ